MNLMDRFRHTFLCSDSSKAFVAVSATSKVVFIVVFVVFFGFFISSLRPDAPFVLSSLTNTSITFLSWNLTKSHQPIESSIITRTIPDLPCPVQLNRTCPAHTSHIRPPAGPTAPSPACPDYFRWIHEDLRPWTSTGISRETLESSKIHAAFRLIVVNGRAYVHHYHRVFQTRDVFTIWGIVQLLRRYPGMIPDLDLMFNCEDMPVVPATASGSPPPPPLFRYCKDDSTVDIVFPDWSFWGWPEVNIRWWGLLMKDLREADQRLRWSGRAPYAQWKGNPYVSDTRQDLMKCNVSHENDWGARLFAVNWDHEERHSFSTSDLAAQCTYRYKVYVEGRSWSVSEKYILGCGSPTLYVESNFQNFVSRGLRPGRHYWPILRRDKCRSIKQAVNWGNKHLKEAQAIGEAASKFINEELKMDYVYDYMFHILTEFSKLLTYKPSKPEESIELCLESVACPFEGKVRDYLMESIEMDPSSSDPCSLPPPFGNGELEELLIEKANGTKTIVASLIHRSSSVKRNVIHIGRVFGCCLVLMMVSVLV